MLVSNAGATDVSDRAARDLGLVRSWWLTEVSASRGFCGGALLGPAAGQYAHVQLFNPLASGVTVRVRDIVISASSAGRVRLATYNTALVTAVLTGVNLVSGAAAAKAIVRTESGAAQLGTLIDDRYVLTGTTHAWFHGWHFQLAAGKGLLFVTQAPDINLGASFVWEES